MPLYILRKHTLPCAVHDVEKIILQLYIDSLKNNGVLMTSFEMRHIVMKVWRREDVWNEFDICVPVKSMRDQINAVNSESMDQYWMDWKPSDKDFLVHGRLTFKTSACPICKEDTGYKIKLRNCSCVFHKKCIEQSVKYSDVCPVCEMTIYKQEKYKQT